MKALNTVSVIHHCIHSFRADSVQPRRLPVKEVDSEILVSLDFYTCHFDDATEGKVLH